MICLMMVSIDLRSATITSCYFKPIHHTCHQQVERAGMNHAHCRLSFLSIWMEGLRQEELEDLNRLLQPGVLETTIQSLSERDRFCRDAWNDHYTYEIVMSMFHEL